MQRRPWGLYAIALAIVIIGLVYLGVPASTLAIGVLVLACPVAMIFMMRAMHGDEDHTDAHGGPHDRHDDRLPPRL
jgi:hypothetical protein